ncbi:SDR family NAD(P)-dependent oxidoreductase [Acuticoccus mangrovi]|uniref:SDR family oxidoreductase n=1 Tax=Acuticoccus mangrovi TaxID=2796142 RepID=A0A934MH20_9HYPH|nr:SDR family oxidoreductase [Acuticoccus mangrovi]MBJ3775601.1 SDR family oxidoreductase [Acuticoccus mangrovi]
MTELAGKRALITGAGSGIGLAIAKAYAEEGASLFLSDINPKRVEDAVAAIEAMGGKATGGVTDVADSAAAKAMVDAAVTHFGALDILVNNAGILDDLYPVADTSDEMWNRVMGVNINGAFYVSRAAIPPMIAAGGGIIVNTLSISSFLGGRGGATYTVSKHAILGLTKAIAVTYADDGIRCNGISPGSVETNISTGEGWPPLGRKLREKGLATRPTRAKPEDIAPVAVFLASDRARYVNGANIVADAGWTAY